MKSWLRYEVALYFCHLTILGFYCLQVGIIGGSGLDNPDILEERHEKHVETPFGKVSATS